MIGDMMYAGAVYEARTHGSVRGMGRKPHPTRFALRNAGREMGDAYIRWRSLP